MLNTNQTQKIVQKNWLIWGGILFFLLSLSFTLLLFQYSSNEKEDYFTGKNPILFKGQQAGNALITGGEVYLPLNFYEEKLGADIAWDEKTNSFILTTAKNVVQMPSESLTYFVNSKPAKLHIPVLTSHTGEQYLALEPLLPLLSIDYKRLPETDAVWIQYDKENYQNAVVTNKKDRKEKLKLQKETSFFSPYTTRVSNQQVVKIQGEKDDYFYVRAENGIAGYIKKKYIREGNVSTITISRNTKEYNPKVKTPFHLTWEAVYKNNPKHEKIPPMPGVNIVSPTWFKLSSNDGSIANLASMEYSNWARKRGYQVWGLFSNDFDPVMTHEAFKNFETRQNIIRQLLHFSKMYGLSGINFDIENVDPKDGPFVTQLIREASPLLHEAGLTVSMDITFISGSGNWSAFYDRKELAQAVDYLAVMAYDEHWATSQKAGSVASLPWVESHLQKLLKVVPAEKLILGVPLYTRLWKEEMMDGGTVKVTSKSLSMEKAQQWIKEHKAKQVYDSDSGQNYVELSVPKEKATYKIWLEDEMSLEKRALLADKYNLAGIASWSRYFGDETAWTALDLAQQRKIAKK